MSIRRDSQQSRNGASAARWERYALSLLSAILALLSFLFWDMRDEITQVRRVQDQRTVLVGQFETMARIHNELLVRLAVVEKQQMIFTDRLSMQSQRIATINRRLDQIPATRVTPEPDAGY